MKLNDEFLDKVAAKIVLDGKPDDLAKFMLAGKESFEAVQRYFNDLEADKKSELTLSGDEWFLGKPEDDVKAVKHSGLPLFKIIASSIIPFVDKLYIMNTQREDYSFLKDVENLEELCVLFTEEKHPNVLAALSSLQSVGYFVLNIESLSFEFLSSLPFSFNRLTANNFIFEAVPNRDKVFQTTSVRLFGNCDLKNDFVFTRENFQNYAAIFPNASRLSFEFYVKIVDNIFDLVKVSNANHINEVKVPNRNIDFAYRFFDYSGFPDSKVLKKLQGDKNWHTHGCPYADAYIPGNAVDMTCTFLWAIDEVNNRLAKQSLWRIPEKSNGKPEDYYQLIIRNDSCHETKFEVLKTISIRKLLKAYGKIAGMDYRGLHFQIDDRLFCGGTVADSLQDGDVIFITYA